MKKFALLNLFFTLALCQLSAAEGIVGFWKTVDENSHKAQSVVGIYEYQGKYYGRLVASYGEDGKVDETIFNPKKRAPGVKSHPYYMGLDIIWNLQPNDNKYINGNILDPQKGKIYGAEMWRQGNSLIVRGKILFLGRNQTWLPVADNEFTENFRKPDLSKFIPEIPKVK